MSSTDASTSTLLRWRPAIIGLTLAAGALSIYYARQAEDDREDGSQRGLHRSNAVRRRSPRLRHARPSIAHQIHENATAGRQEADEQAVETRRQSFAGTLDVPEDETTVDTADPSDGQSLLNMLYHIAVEQSNREGYVHRGVTCNACNVYPIRGVRYRCANCPDYDLCEQCESLGNIHDRTHLFYKIRIPAPFLGANPRQQQPVWYPGKPHVNPRTVPNGLKKQLSDSTGLERSLIDALWDQFKTLAGCDWPDDPNGLYIAIDRDIWAKYCVSPLMKKHTSSMALLFDRSFSFWDDNQDGLIGFEEFLQGLVVRQSKNRKESNRRTFRAHDLDGDGYVTRQDFLYLFVAHYAYCKEQSRDMAQFIEDEVLEGGQLRETLQSTQAVSSCFHGNIPHPDSPRVGHGKTINSVGDMVITDGGWLLSQDNDGLVNLHDEVGELGVAEQQRNDHNALADIFESLSQSMPDWPPNFVTSEDAHKALGRQAALEEITEPSDQRRVLDAANRRLEHSRDAWESGRSSSRRRSQVLAHSEAEESGDHLLSGPIPIFTPESELYDPRLGPGPDVTREFLFQKSAEGLNEFLDPMFRQLEDLVSFHDRTEAERLRLREKLDAYKVAAGNTHLCQKWLDTTLESWRQGDSRKAWTYGDDLSEDILNRLMTETEIGSSEWMVNMKERIRSGFTTEEEEKATVERLQSMGGEEQKAKARELQRVSVIVRRGDDPSAEELDQLLSEELLDDQRHRSLSPKSRHHSNADVPSDLDIDEAIQEILNDPIMDEIEHNADAFDHDIDIAAEVNSRTVEELLASAGYELAVSNTLEQPLDDHNTRNRLTEARDSVADSDRNFRSTRTNSVLDLFVRDNDDGSPDLMDAEDTLDPTLPHHRPNTADENAEPVTLSSYMPARPFEKGWMRWSHVNQQGTMASIEEHDQFEDQDSVYFQVKLKFLTILELYDDMCNERNGYARINVDEFEQLMSGNKEGNLRMIGEWLNLANF